MKELLEAAAEADAANLPYNSHFHVWAGLARYTIHLPYLEKSVKSGDSYHYHYYAVDYDLQRCLGGLYIAMEHKELFADNSLLAKAVETVGANDFETYVLIPYQQDKKSGNTGGLKEVNIGTAGKVLARIADTLQSGKPVRDIDRAFWNKHLGAVENAPTLFDSMNFTKRSPYHTVGTELELPASRMPYPIVAETPPVEAAPPVPPPPPDAVTGELVRQAYTEELMRLQTGVPHPPAYDDPDLHNKDLGTRLQTARDRARADFEASRQDVTESAPDKAPVAEPPPAVTQIAAPQPLRWPESSIDN